MIICRFAQLPHHSSESHETLMSGARKSCMTYRILWRETNHPQGRRKQFFYWSGVARSKRRGPSHGSCFEGVILQQLLIYTSINVQLKEVAKNTRAVFTTLYKLSSNDVEIQVIQNISTNIFFTITWFNLAWPDLFRRYPFVSSL